jgi:hypothetical protein
MHTPETRNQFLKLRARGLSFNRISAQLHISKPTLIAWSRKCTTELRSLKEAAQQQLQSDLLATREEEFNRLNTLISALRQELVTRALRPLSNHDIEKRISELEHRLEKLNHSTASSAPSNNTD